MDWTCQVGERLSISSLAVHLAVRILDLFMDAHEVEPPRLYLVCLCCLLLAAKVEEKDSRVPRTPLLNSFAENRYPLSQFSVVEAMIMSYFGWNLAIPTVQHFVELVGTILYTLVFFLFLTVVRSQTTLLLFQLFPYSFFPSDDLLNGQAIAAGDVERVRGALHNFVRHFADTSLQVGIKIA